MFANIGKILYYKYILIILPIVFSVFYGNSGALRIALYLDFFYLIVYLIKKHRLFDLFDFFLLAFSFYTIAITAYFHILSPLIIRETVILALFPIFIRYELRASNTILKSIYTVYAGLIIANFITILFPTISVDGGLVYLFGGKNTLAVALIPAMFFVSYYSYATYDKLRLFSVALIALILASLIMSHSSTAAIIALVAISFLALLRIFYIPPIIYIITYASGIFILLSNRLLNELPLIPDLVSKYFDKDLTFSGRTTIWNLCFDYISQNPMGYGRGNRIILDNYNNAYGQVIGSAHNTFLDMLLAGGIVLILLFIIILIGSFSFRRLKQKSMLARISYFYVFLYLLLGLTESVPFRIEFWMMLAIISSSNYVIINRELGAKNET